jgi:hypothetical protein
MLETEVGTQPATPADLPVDHEAPHRLTDTHTWLMERIDGRVGAAVVITWWVLTAIRGALEPRAQFELPFISLLLELAMYSLLVTMAAGLVMQRRWGLLAAVGVALLLTAASIACPLTGHHHFGTWWIGQMACALTLVGVTVFALRRDYSEFNPE